MLWEISINKPTGYSSHEDLPENYKFMPIGKARRIRKELSELFDGIDWSHPYWIPFETDGLEVVLRIDEIDDEIVSRFRLRISGEGDPLPIIAAIRKQFGCEAESYSLRLDEESEEESNRRAAQMITELCTERKTDTSLHRRPSADVSRFCRGTELPPAVLERGFHYLMDCWRNTVAKVEAPYSCTFDEYLNDVEVRKSIERLLPFASDDECVALDVQLPPLDDRFRAVTRPVEDCIRGEVNAAKYGYLADHDWWYYRVPINLDCVSDRDSWP